MSRVILFGAGKRGRLLANRLRLKQGDIECLFCDNDKKKIGGEIDGIRIISFDEMIRYHNNGAVIVLTPQYSGVMKAQLNAKGVMDYIEYHYPNDLEMLDNPNAAGVILPDKHDIELEEFVRATDEIDPLLNSEEFSKITVELLNKSDGFIDFHNIQKNRGGESNFYGHLEALKCFLGYTDDDYHLFPIISHYPDYYSGVVASYMYDKCVIFSGAFNKALVNKYSFGVPSFAIGPYIYYATDSYGPRIKELKEKYGRILTVFLPHSIEGMNGRQYSRAELLEKIHMEYQKKYDSVWVCVYWIDINDDVCSFARELGMKVVCVGARFDNKFINRMKSLMNLSDATIHVEFGSSVLHSLCCGKPVIRLDAGADLRGDGVDDLIVLDRVLYGKEYQQCVSEFISTFDENAKFDYRKTYFAIKYGGLNQIKTREELKSIFEICMEINKRNCDNDEPYLASTACVYRNYLENFQFDKALLLKHALGNINIVC